MPDSPQEVRDVSAQEDTAQVPDPEIFANVGTSVGQTALHASSFMSSPGLGRASEEPAPDYFRFPLSLPSNQAIDILSLEVPRLKLGTHAADPRISDSSLVSNVGACQHLYECWWVPTVGSRKGHAKDILVVGGTCTKNVYCP